jgi:16S rRNA (cytosine967-C5)-methyltransferase
MKWYPNLANEIVKALDAIFNQKKQGDKVINSLLKSHPKWGSRDRKFVAKILYDITRWKRLYEYLAETNITSNEGKWHVMAAWSILNDISLPDWIEFNKVNSNKILERYYNITDPKIKHSYPDWLYDLFLKHYNTRTEAELEALNQEASVTIRVNTLKTNRGRLQELLSNEGVETYILPEYIDALFLKDRKKLTHLKLFKQGFFEVQDASSQQIAPFTNAKPGQTVIDACAGAGGKTLHLAAQMQNKGQILAYDIYPSKIYELNKRVKRNGVKNLLETGIIDSSIVKKNKNKADILLLDAPCSSLGTLRRKPDLKWKITLEKLQQINVIQKDILHNYETMLKSGGQLIYVTCSILPEENQNMINDFLNKHKNYTFVSDKIILPSTSIGDGFYMAKLTKHTS